jgi:hypothetical protein
MANPILGFLVSPQNTMMRNRKTAAGVSLLIASVILIVPVVKKEKNPCRVDLGNPHISTFIAERNGLAAVKVNAFSICNRPHSRITLTVELWKEETVFKKRIRVAIARHQGMILPNVKFENNRTFAPCLSSAETLYFAKAYGKALIEGEWNYASDKSEKSFTIKCGT